MYLRRDELTRTVRAPAKLNVYLEVLGRRGDGFHELQTLMVPIRLWDSLTFESTRPFRNDQPEPIAVRVRSGLRGWPASGAEVLPPEDNRNLVVRALELLRVRSGCDFGARVELTKRIPVGAGLGGGSSDAAAALRVANRLWGLNWGRDRLNEVGAEIGSDIPFFLHSGPAICRGRGERVERIPSIRPLPLVAVKPPESLETAAVYREFDALKESSSRPAAGDLERLVRALCRGTWQEIGRWMTNQLEGAAVRLAPWIERVRAVFSTLDCLGYQLSGSGSTYFAVCRHAQHARRVAALLRARRLGLVYALRSC